MNPTMNVFEYADYVSAYVKELVALVAKRLDDAGIDRAYYCNLDLTTIAELDWLSDREAFIAAAHQLMDELAFIYYDERIEKVWATAPTTIAATALHTAVSSGTLVHNKRYIEFYLQRLRDVDSPEKFLGSHESAYIEMGMKYLAPTKGVDNE